MTVFVDASSLIAIIRIGELSLLRDLFSTVSITDVVLAEVTVKKHTALPVHRAIRDGWLRVIEVTPNDAAESV